MSRAQPMIKTLVVDDSGLMRLAISEMINQEPDMEVIGTAEDGRAAVEQVKSLHPDVVVMDMVMGKHSGTYAIREIIRERYLPIIILSSVGHTQPDHLFEALEMGAFDFIDKPEKMLTKRIREIQPNLVALIRQAVLTQREGVRNRSFRQNQHPHTFAQELPYDVLALGASTGGPRTLESILTRLPGNFALPVLIAQHMPERFIQSFAKRLDACLQLRVVVGREGTLIRPGTVYLASGAGNMEIQREGKEVRIRYSHQHHAHFNNPSIDGLFLSVARVYGNKALLVLLTGMGKDGVVGMEAAYQAGAFTIAQDKQSSVVHGMPGAAIERKVVKEILNLKEIPAFIVSCL